MPEYDLLVIGAGPGGYHAAIRAAQLGLKTAVAEMGEVGGVCLNIGCIPTKALLHAGDQLHDARAAASFGLHYPEPKVEISELNRWKDGVVKKLTGGVGTLLKANRIDLYRGAAHFLDPHTVAVGETKVSAQHIIVAVGSEPATLAGFEVDGQQVVDSTGALQLPDPLPKRLLAIGGGAIGLEFAHIYNNLGCEVTVIEYTDQIVPGADQDASKALAKALSQRGITISTGTKATGLSRSGGALTVTLEAAAGGQARQQSFDRVLVAVGRKPRSHTLNLAEVGVTVDARGFIPTDDRMRTNVPHIYAIGDVAGAPLLAHKAMKEGLVAAEVIAGKASSMDAVAIPNVVYTTPELATVGLSEAEAKARGYSVKIGSFPLSASGRAMTLNDTEGMVKMVSDAETDLLLGVHIVAPHGSDLLGEASLALEMAATVRDIALTIHAHPTLSETLLEAAENVHRQAIHIVNR
jgi:dihydrolipoamide dehydrogenase